VLAACLAVFAALDMPIVYMSNRWFRTNHPQPVFNDIDPRMGMAMMWNIFAFLAFGILVAWFRYDLERMSQRISSAFVAKATRASVGMLAVPALFLFGGFDQATPRTYLTGATIVVWTIYASYLIFLLNKRRKLKQEEVEMHAG
jgi:Ca2+/H+ antiporter